MTLTLLLTFPNLNDIHSSRIIMKTCAMTSAPLRLKASGGVRNSKSINIKITVTVMARRRFHYKSGLGLGLGLGCNGYGQETLPL